MPADIYYQAADAVLAALGISPGAVNVNLLVAWSLAEWGGTDDLDLTNNPMATTYPEPGATDWNGAGVKVYPSLQTGAQATAQTLGSYPVLTAALRAGDASSFFGPGAAELSIWASGSATGDLGYAASIQNIYQGLGQPPAWALAAQAQSAAVPATTGGLSAAIVAVLALALGGLAYGVAELEGWI
jgi:hypothetical protein